MANSDFYTLCEGKGCFVRYHCKRYTNTQNADIECCDSESRMMYDAKDTEDD